MKRISYFFAIALFATTQSAWAFCKPFWPVDRIFVPEDNMHVFIDYEDSIERMAVQPGFRTDVTDFGMVVATPSRPSLSEAPTFIFDDLENLTNPFRPIPLMAMAEDSVNLTKSSGVTVIEEKEVGDYTTTVLRANDATDLIEWLDENDYNYQDSDEKTFDYYIDEGGYYFTALKINTTDTTDMSLTRPAFNAKLTPIEIAFQADAPILPIRIMKADMNAMSLTLYTLGEDMVYIPGVDTLYAQKITSENLPEVAIRCVTTPCIQPDQWANTYNARDGRWLVRQDLQINPRNITKDLMLSESSSGYEVHPEIDGKRTINSAQFDTTTGIIKGSAAAWGSAVSGYGALLNGTRLLRRGSRGDDVKDLQTFMNNNIQANLVADGIWGPKTAAAVTAFQNEYNLQRDGIVGPQTRKFIRIVLGT